MFYQKKTSKKPEVSIIIPVYNGEQYIKDTILSVLNQTYRNYELIIVDDGSTDTTKQIIDIFKDPRIKYHYQNNTGLSASRNKGIELSQGEFLAFLDADDIWLPFKLELQVNAIKNDFNVGLVFGWVYYMDNDSRIVGNKKYDITKDFYINILLGNYVDNGSQPLIRRECFDKVGKFDHIPAEDWDMWIRIAKEYKFCNINDFLVIYRINLSGLSKNYKNMEEGLFKILNREFSNNTDIKGIKNKAYAYRFHYLSTVCRGLTFTEEAFSYMLKAIKLYPLILLNKTRNIELLKLLLSVLMSKGMFIKLRSIVRNMYQKNVCG